jgi:hypothetical protein
LHNYVIPRRVLDATRAFLYARGLRGAEAVVVWIGPVLDDTTAEITDAYVPEQIAHKSDYGASVEVTQEGLTRLISSLEPGTFVVCRVHSHPSEAYHSDLDDMNMLISHQGAISIVVPYFARGTIALEECSVNELVHDRGWRELGRREVAERFHVID